MLVQEQTRQVSNDLTQLSEAINEEKQIIDRFEREIEQQRGVNFRRNDENLDLLAQSEALENHIRMLYDQNSLIESEINTFISEDDELANRLEGRSQSRSKSPTNRDQRSAADTCIKTYTRPADTS